MNRKLYRPSHIWSSEKLTRKWTTQICSFFKVFVGHSCLALTADFAVLSKKLLSYCFANLGINFLFALYFLSIFCIMGFIKIHAFHQLNLKLDLIERQFISSALEYLTYFHFLVLLEMSYQWKLLSMNENGV